MVVCGQVFWESKKDSCCFYFSHNIFFFSFKERYSKLTTAHISPSGCRRKTRNVKKKLDPPPTTKTTTTTKRQFPLSNTLLNFFFFKVVKLFLA